MRPALLSSSSSLRIGAKASRVSSGKLQIAGGMDEPNSRISDFLKEQYQKELDRRSDFTSRITLLSGVLTLLGGGSLAMARELVKPVRFYEWLESGAVLISMLFIIFSAWWIWHAYTNIEYYALPSPADLLAYRDSLEDYYCQAGCQEGKTPRSVADAELLSGINNAYAQLTRDNFRVNERRSRSLKRANKYFLLAISIASLALVLQLYRITVSPPRVQEVRITNIRELRMTQHGSSAESAAGSPKPTTANNQPSTTQAAKKPEFPPPRVIREDFLPGKQTR